jgi:hypothetical protein
MSVSWLGVEFCFIASPLEWGTHEPPSFIVNQRQGEGKKKKRKCNKIELESSLSAGKEATSLLRTNTSAGSHLAFSDFL